MTLLLFDIDGTLLNGHGAGRAAVEEALRTVASGPAGSENVSFSGKTDPQIARELLAQDDDAEDEALHARTTRFLDCYAERLAETIADARIEALPGTHALLERLTQRSDVLLGLLTGNLERTAHLKLRAAGLDGFFACGAFGSDHADRDRLVPFATRRARAHSGRAFSGREVVVIGDTPRDVRCGQAHAARTVGVCTGHYDRPALTAAGADHVFADLSDADAFVTALL